MLDLGEKISAIFESLIKFLMDSFVAPFKDLPTLKNLVFGKYNDDLVWSTFHEKDLTKAFSPIFNTMTTLAGFCLVAFIIFSGMRIASSSMIASRRNEMFESVKDLLLVVILLFNLPLIYDLLFGINDGLIKLFSSAYDSKMDELKADDEKTGIIGNIFIQLILLGLAVWANFYYMMRRVSLLILMGMGPVMVVCWMFPRWKGITSAWFKELTGSIFVQSVHAFVFWTIAIMSNTATGFVETVIVYVIFIPITESLRKLLGMGGDMQGGFSKAGSMMGLTALGGVAGAVKGAIGEKSVMGALSAMKNGAKGNKGDSKSDSDSDPGDTGKTIAASAGSDSGTTSRAEKMLKPGDIVSKLGKATLGAAGAIAGSATGPVGTLIGAQGASMVGGAIGGVAGRTGASGAMALANRIKAGKNAMSDLNAARSQDFDEGMADMIATSDTDKWATDNKDAIMTGLKEKFPDATQKELDSKFDQIKADKKDQLMGEARGQWANAKDTASKVGKGGSLISASAGAMAAKWADNNQQSFMDEYDQTNPQQAGETDAAYLARRANAFNEKVGQVKNQFAEAGEAYTNKFGGGNVPVSREGFNKHMANSLNGMTGMGNVDGLANASAEAVNSVQGEQMFTSNGTPNAAVLANSLAHAKTSKMGKDFIEQEIGRGVSEETARGNWASQEAGIHQQNVDSYSSSGFQDSAQALRQTTMPKGKVAALAQSLGTVSGAMVGLPEMKRAVGQVNTGLAVGMQTLAETSQSEGMLKAVPAAFRGGMQGMVAQSIADNGGNAVQAEANFVNRAGFAGGIVVGAAGYKAAKNFAMKNSPYQNQVESQISSPSDVIQMAQTVTDVHGNKQIAPGAIRQVVTANSSHIEVLTKGGERQVISRMTAGHSGLANGDTVYQDLNVDNDMLVPLRSSGGRGGSTYRLDSGGARIPSSVAISTDPNNILGNPLRSSKHAPVQQQQAPVFNQKVDSGSFHIEDLASQGMSKVEVVTSKGKQYVTAEKDGQRYRVSPVFAGDSRLANSESFSILVAVEKNKLKAIASNIPNSVVADMPDGDQTDYFSSNGVSGLIMPGMIESKHAQHAKKSAERRSVLDNYGRKQGLLG